MNAASKKAILIVSFGTSYENTRKRTIDAIERDIADAFPGPVRPIVPGQAR